VAAPPATRLGKRELIMLEATAQEGETMLGTLGVECALPAGFYPGNDIENIGSKEDKMRWTRAEREDIRQTRWRRMNAILIAVLFLLGAWHLGRGLYIEAKAQLAQWLISDAWAQTLAGGAPVKPWPWADTWPVAKLTLSVTGQDVALYVLEGANGSAMAFGPGHLQGTPLPGEAGNNVIAGHRDTHLAFMRALQAGDELSVERRDGRIARYRVNAMEVLDKRDTWVTKNEGPTRLTLVTCWPFDALRAGGPERYVVFANAVTPVAPVVSMALGSSATSAASASSGR